MSSIMTWTERKRLMLQLPLIISGVFLVFWSTWYMVNGYIPGINSIEINPKFIYTLPFFISRQWDVLVSPAYALVVIFIFTSKEFMDNLDKEGVIGSLFGGFMAGLIAGIMFSPGFGFVFGLIVSLVFGLATGILFGIIPGFIIGLAFGLLFSIGPGLVFGLSFGLAFSFLISLGLCLVLGFLAIINKLIDFFREEDMY